MSWRMYYKTYLLVKQVYTWVTGDHGVSILVYSHGLHYGTRVMGMCSFQEVA